jgi:hypothetical protein
MIETAVHERNSKLGEYLQLLRLMALELDRATQAIVQNSLTAFEDSIANQEAFSIRLSELAKELSRPVKERRLVSAPVEDSELMGQIRAASDTLQTLNRGYSALIRQSSQSVARMVSLFSSFQGQFQEGSGPRLKRQTWSCQI